MDVAVAIRHLRERLADGRAADSRHRPHWTAGDLDAVATLVERPAAAEQIALARIEGISLFIGYDGGEKKLKRINVISRKALGLPVQ